jgi:hypothetical protein
MAEKVGVEFEIGEAFPPGSRLARWATICAMAMNDLLLVNRWLIPRLNGEVPSEGYENVYLLRLAASHLYEIAVFLRTAERWDEVSAFVAGLDAEPRSAYAALLELGRDGSSDFTLKVKGARNSFSHYSELLGDEAADHELLRAALAAHAEERTRGRIRDQVPPLTGFRALFADDVAIELTFPGGEDEELGKLIEGISVHIGHFLLFVRAAFGAYIATLPPEIFEDWLEED